jgi:hypothetical protein
MCSSPGHALKSGLESKSRLESYNTVGHVSSLSCMWLQHETGLVPHLSEYTIRIIVENTSKTPECCTLRPLPLWKKFSFERKFPSSGNAVYLLKADFQSSHEAPRSSLPVHAWALSSNHNAKLLILIRCKHSQRAARSFMRGLEIRLYSVIQAIQHKVNKFWKNIYYIFQDFTINLFNMA